MFGWRRIWRKIIWADVVVGRWRLRLRSRFSACSACWSLTMGHGTSRRYGRPWSRITAPPAKLPGQPVHKSCRPSRSCRWSLSHLCQSPFTRLIQRRLRRARRLTRRANHRHNGIITEVRWFPNERVRLAHADECTPAGSQPCSYKYEQRIVAKRAAILAHRYTQRADLVTARRVKQARQNREHGSNEKHPKASLRSVGPRVAASTANDFISVSLCWIWFARDHLTCRANQVHIDIIADIVEPAPETAAGFSVSQKQSARTVSICRNRFVEFSAICSPLENGLTRRANHRHNANIAKIAKSARRNPSRAFCL